MPQEDASAASAGGDPAEIALMISDHRRSAKLSQAALGRLCGMGQGRISMIECGYVNLSVDALGRFASAFGKRLVISFE